MDAVAALLAEIREASQEAWLATRDLESGARVRTILLFEADLEAGRLLFATNRTHAKWAQIEADPVGEICLVDVRGPMQLRFRCRFAELPEHGVRRRYWTRHSPRDRARLYGPSGDEPAAEFAVVEGKVLEVDYLDLRPEKPVRFRFRDGEVRELSP